jgi:hypothetical protein
LRADGDFEQLLRVEVGVELDAGVQKLGEDGLEIVLDRPEGLGRAGREQAVVDLELELVGAEA